MSDKKLSVDSDGNGTVDYYNADVVTANDYFPFGSQMPGRKYSQANIKYRYGFNGKENDNEVKGEGNQQDYGMRIYDPRLGRFLSEDPITDEYPELTPYQSASNRPIDGIDLDGLEFLTNFKSNQLKHFEASNLLKQQEAAEVYKEKQRAVLRKLPIKTPPTVGSHRQPDGTQTEINKNRAAVYKATHPEPTKLEKNKNFQKFADNIAIPTIAAVAGDGAGKVLFKGISLIKDRIFYTTIFRTIDAVEANSINTFQKFSFGPNGADMKQFWLKKNAYNTYINTAEGRFANGFKLEVKVPKSLVGQEKVLNTSVQVDDFLFQPATINSATINGQSGLDKLNKIFKGIKITKE